MFCLAIQFLIGEIDHYRDSSLQGWFKKSSTIAKTHWFLDITFTVNSLTAMVRAQVGTKTSNPELFDIENSAKRIKNTTTTPTTIIPPCQAFAPSSDADISFTDRPVQMQCRQGIGQWCGQSNLIK